MNKSEAETCFDDAVKQCEQAHDRACKQQRKLKKALYEKAKRDENKETRIIQQAAVEAVLDDESNGRVLTDKQKGRLLGLDLTRLELSTA